MYFVIDHDTRTVECVHDNENDLVSYYSGDICIALAIVGSVEDIVNCLSPEEMADMLFNLTGENVLKKQGVLISEEELAENLWMALEEYELDAPEFPPVKPKPKPKPKSKPKSKPKGAQTGNLIVGDTTPSRGRHTNIVNFIEENFGKVSYAEIAEYLKGEKGTPGEHISFALRKGFLKLEE